MSVKEKLKRVLLESPDQPSLLEAANGPEAYDSLERIRAEASAERVARQARITGEMAKISVDEVVLSPADSRDLRSGQVPAVAAKSDVSTGNSER